MRTSDLQEDSVCQLLAELFSPLGLYWLAYDGGGGRRGGRPPHDDLSCLQAGRCPVLGCDGTCPGADSVALPSVGGQLRVCTGSPLGRPGVQLAPLLARALETRWQAEEDMEGTVRELASTYQELAIAYDLLEVISVPTSRELIAQSVLNQIANALGAVGACFLTLTSSQGAQILASQGLSELDQLALRLQLVAAQEAHPDLDTPFSLRLGSLQVLACAVRGDSPFPSLIAVCREGARVFTSREAKLLRASGRQAGLAIRNRTLVDELRSLFVSTVQALVAAIEAKDPYTCGHSRRVAESARATAATMGLAETQVEDIHTAAIVHDVGKIAVDTAILRKEGRLDESEWQAVRIHPERGAGIVDCVPQLRHISAAVRHHHERSDGRGYPNGLDGSRIPLEASIIAVCDSFDAMTSERPYRAAMPGETARRELVECRGSQFNPIAVEAFLDTHAA